MPLVRVLLFEKSIMTSGDTGNVSKGAFQTANIYCVHSHFQPCCIWKWGRDRKRGECGVEKKITNKQTLTFIALFNHALITNSECQKSPLEQSTQSIINTLQTVTSHCQIGVRRFKETAANGPLCYSHHNSFKTNTAYKLAECRNFTITSWIEELSL
jgi:hypothetical protein